MIIIAIVQNKQLNKQLNKVLFSESVLKSGYQV